MDKKNKKQGLVKKIMVVVAIIAVLGAFYAVFWGHAIYRPFEDFKGPEYLPAGYNNTDNLTTDNERIFEYSGNGTFWVGVIKDPNQNQLNETMNPFADDSEGIKEKKENITVNSHHVLFQVHEMSLNIQKMVKKVPALNKYNVPNISMAKFQSKWYCEETGLTYVAIGFVTSDQLEEMKKMMQSIQCHKKDSIFSF